MTVYQDIRTYSPLHDGYVHRISMGNEHGHELYMLLLNDEGARTYRAHRMAALDAIQEAIDMGCDPGEVRVEAGAWERMVAEAALELGRE